MDYWVIDELDKQRECERRRETKRQRERGQRQERRNNLRRKKEQKTGNRCKGTRRYTNLEILIPETGRRMR